MDILAHALWAGAGTALVARRRPVTAGTAAATVAAASLPDVVQMLPQLVAAAAGTLTWTSAIGYAIAAPGQEPALPPMVALLSHHLHCAAHSLVVAAGVSVLLLTVVRAAWLPLLGWWLHIGIDVFTHSRAYYPVPVLYPFSERSFDGVAWNEPWLLALNYLLLTLTYLALASTCVRSPRASSDGQRLL